MESEKSNRQLSPETIKDLRRPVKKGDFRLTEEEFRKLEVVGKSNHGLWLCKHGIPLMSCGICRRTLENFRERRRGKT